MGLHRAEGLIGSPAVGIILSRLTQGNHQLIGPADSFSDSLLELLTRSESDGKGPSNPPSQGLLQSSSHTCGYTSLPNMAPIIDTSGVSIVVTVQEIPHSNI